METELYEQKIGALNEKTSESYDLAIELYILLKDEVNDNKRDVLDDVIVNLKEARRRISHIDTRE